jgi:RimJ/RimL family protein N-acetyltransferase
VIRIATDRLIVTSGTERLAEAELADSSRLGLLLGARVPPSWPPESLQDVVPTFLAACRARGDCGPWTLPWYAVLKTSDGAILCASIGFKGSPRAMRVELGYSVLPEFQARGIATEMVMGVSRWALAEAGVAGVEAEVFSSNAASARVLEKAGFEPCGPGLEPGATRYRRDGAAQLAVAADGASPRR